MNPVDTHRNITLSNDAEKAIDNGDPAHKYYTLTSSNQVRVARTFGEKTWAFLARILPAALGGRQRVTYDQATGYFTKVYDWKREGSLNSQNPYKKYEDV